jgi:hypothetical protein
MAAVERIMAMTFHVSAAVLVLQVFQQGNSIWLGAAISFHALIDAIAVVVLFQKWNRLVWEAVLALLTIPLASFILMIFREKGDGLFQEGSEQHVFNGTDDEIGHLDEEVQVRLIKRRRAFHGGGTFISYRVRPCLTPQLLQRKTL